MVPSEAAFLTSAQSPPSTQSPAHCRRAGETQGDAWCIGGHSMAMAQKGGGHGCRGWCTWTGKWARLSWMSVAWLQGWRLYTTQSSYHAQQHSAAGWVGRAGAVLVPFWLLHSSKWQRKHGHRLCITTKQEALGIWNTKSASNSYPGEQRGRSQGDCQLLHSCCPALSSCTWPELLGQGLC